MAGQGYEAQSSGGGVYSLGAVSKFTARRSMQMFSHNTDRKFSARRARKRVLDELGFGNSRISPIVLRLSYFHRVTPAPLQTLGSSDRPAIPFSQKATPLSKSERRYTEHVADLGVVGQGVYSKLHTPLTTSMQMKNRSPDARS